MIPTHILNLALPDGEITEPKNEHIGTPEENDAWHLENMRLRHARGDFSRSDTPVNVMFEWNP